MKRDTIFNREILSLLSPLPLFFFSLGGSNTIDPPLVDAIPLLYRGQSLRLCPSPYSSPFRPPSPPPSPRNQTDKVVLKYSKFRRRGRGEEEEDPGTRAKKWRDRLAFNMRQSSTLTFPV